MVRTSTPLGALSLLLASVLCTPVGAQESSGVPVSLSDRGFPGLVQVPVAADLPRGRADLGFSTTPDYDLWGGRAKWQYNVQFALSFFDRVVLSGRGTEAQSVRRGNRYPIETGSGFVILVPLNTEARDLSGSIHALLAREGDTWPAVAVGVSDIGGGNAIFEGRYGVVSKTLFDRLRLTGGYGLGPDILDGFFGGVEWAPSSHLTLMAEHDSRQLNAGVRLMPLPDRWTRGAVPELTLDMILNEGEGLSWGVAIRTPLDPDLAAGGSSRPETGVRTGPPPEDAGELGEFLSARGLENIRVSRTGGGRLIVDYENRRYNRNELDGLAVVLRAAASAAVTADSLSVVIRQVDRPLVRVDLALSDLRAVVDGSLPAHLLRDRVRAGWAGGHAQDAAADSPGVNPSRLRLDLIAQPALETFIFTELGVWDGRISVLPRGLVQLFPGTTLEGAYRVPLDQTSDYHLVDGPLPDPALERVLLHHARRLPFRRPGSDLWAQWSIGRFDAGHVGVRQEVAFLLMDGRVRLGGDLAWVGPTFGGLDRVVATGGVRYHFPAAGTRLALTAGRYLDGDHTVVGELSRFYGDTEVGLFMRHSDRGSQAGISVALPLTPTRDLRPRRVRPRLPARWSYAQQATVFADRGIIRRDIGRTLSPEHSLENAYFDRDRLSPATVEEALADPRFWRR